MPNVLFFISSLSAGGAERVVANLANHWADKGWKITVVTLSDGNRDHYALSLAVQRISLGLLHESVNPFMGMLNNLRRLFALHMVLRRIKPDIALAMMEKANILLALASIGIPHLVTLGSERIHPPQSPVGSLWENLRRYCYCRLDTVVALAQESRDWLLHHTKVTNVVIIPNAVSLPLARQTPTLAPKEILTLGRKTLLAVGRLSYQKGFDLLITAYSRVAERYSDWDLVILGEGGQRDMLQRQIEFTGLGSRIKLLGRVGNVADWYESADIYVMSSLFEGFPNTLVEAMAHGLPAVSFDCDTGPRDIIRHEVDGLLVANGDVPALAQALNSLMGDEARRAAMSNNAIEARARFSLDRIACMWEQLFDELIMAKGKPL